MGLGSPDARARVVRCRQLRRVYDETIDDMLKYKDDYLAAAAGARSGTIGWMGNTTTLGRTTSPTLVGTSSLLPLLELAIGVNAANSNGVDGSTSRKRTG